RPGDLWERHQANDLNKQLPLEALGTGFGKLDELGKVIEQSTGIHPREIERATVVVLKSPERVLLEIGDMGDADTRDSLVILLATSRPYSPEKFRTAMRELKNHKPRDFRDKTIYEGQGMRDGPAYCAFNEKILPIGETKALEL